MVPLTLLSAESHIVAKLSDKVIVASKGVPALWPLQPHLSFKNPPLNNNQIGKTPLPLEQTAKIVADTIK